jgi:uncharacterized protein (DUF433 family)
MRLSVETDELVAREARRTRRTKGAVVEALAEEALRTRRFPGIAFRGADSDRRAWVIGTGLDVWEIVRARRGFADDTEMLAATDLTPSQLHLALTYSGAFEQEISDAIADNDLSLEELRHQHPTVATIAV